ncbi:MAG: hypothetical protein ACOCYN_02225 [Planctomycetota bacterium]
MPGSLIADNGAAATAGPHPVPMYAFAYASLIALHLAQLAELLWARWARYHLTFGETWILRAAATIVALFVFARVLDAQPSALLLAVHILLILITYNLVIAFWYCDDRNTHTIAERARAQLEMRWNPLRVRRTVPLLRSAGEVVLAPWLLAGAAQRGVRRCTLGATDEPLALIEALLMGLVGTLFLIQHLSTWDVLLLRKLEVPHAMLRFIGFAGRRRTTIRTPGGLRVVVGGQDDQTDEPGGDPRQDPT